MTSTEIHREVVREDDGPVVFVCQNQHRWSEEDRAFVPKFDFSRAAEYGNLVEVLSPTAAPFHFRNVQSQLHEKLKHYREGDFVLLVGNPAFIGAVTALAAAYNAGRVTVLQWSGKDQKYEPIRMENLCVGRE